MFSVSVICFRSRFKLISCKAIPTEHTIFENGFRDYSRIYDRSRIMGNLNGGFGYHVIWNKPSKIGIDIVIWLHLTKLRPNGWSVNCPSCLSGRHSVKLFYLILKDSCIIVAPISFWFASDGRPIIHVSMFLWVTPDYNQLHVTFIPVRW